MNTLITKYLEDKKLAWAPSTLRSEKHRLNALAHVLSGKPEELWAELEAKGMGKYSRLTTWVRVTAFWEWLLEEGHKEGVNEYKKWKKKNARQFRHVYEEKKSTVSFEEARQKLLSITNESLRQKALQLLSSGMRFTESFTLRPDGSITGKGSKRRRVYGAIGRSELDARCYQSLRRVLGELGLRPQTLRKIFATELNSRGVSPFELCEVLGWSDPKTAMKYVNPNQTTIMKVVTDMQGSNNGSSTKAGNAGEPLSPAFFSESTPDSRTA